jgi:dGTP triphosphohydrolase
MLILHLAHWWTMHNAIAEWSSALTERVIADSRLASLREEHRTLHGELNDCRTMLAYKSGDADKALERRIAEQVAEIEAGERAEAARRAEISAEMDVEAKTVSRRYSEATTAVQNLLRNTAHNPESIQIYKWGDLIKDANGTYLLACQWSWENKSGRGVLQHKIFRFDAKGRIIEIIDF